MQKRTINRDMFQQWMHSIKYVFITTLALSITLSAFAQPSKVTNALNYLRYNDIDKAKLNIDVAIDHPKSKVQSKTWYVRGLVYLEMTTVDKYKDAEPNPLDVAFESFMKAYEFDMKRVDEGELKQKLQHCSREFYNQGVGNFNLAINDQSLTPEGKIKKYQATLSNFENVGKIYKKLKMQDDSLLMATVFWSGRAARYASNEYSMQEKPEKSKEMANVALEKYQKCMDWKYGGADIYREVFHVYKSLGQVDKGVEYLKKGRELYPNNANLVLDEVNYYLDQKKYDKVLENMDVAVKADPANPVLYFVQGFANDQIKSKYEKDFVDTYKGGNNDSALQIKETATQYYTAAASSYKKAVELKEDYFDALYNLGALYYNWGAMLEGFKNNLDLDQQELTDQITAEADGWFEKATPILEKAHAINPEDKNTMTSLKNIYARNGQMDKYEEIKNKLTN